MSTFIIASVKNTHTHHAHIVFWAPSHCGYRMVVNETTGRYCFGEAMSLNDGEDCIAVPSEVVEALVSPEPYFRNYKGEPARFYDTPGPVVENTRANWKALIAASIKAGRHTAKVKPEVFRGKRRAFALADLPTKVPTC